MPGHDVEQALCSWLEAENLPPSLVGRGRADAVEVCILAVAARRYKGRCGHLLGVESEADPAGVNRAVGNGAVDGLGLERVAKAGLILDGVARHLKVEGKNGTNSVWIVLPSLERSFNRTILLGSLPDGRCFGNLQLSPWIISTSKRDASRVARYPQKVRRR